MNRIHMKCLICPLAFLLLFSCTTETKMTEQESHASIEEKLSVLSRKHAEAEMNDDLPLFIATYHPDAICMPEYQFTLDGQTAIEAYYAKIFERQDVKSFENVAEEYIHLDSSSVVEIGTFTKRVSAPGNDSITTFHGKYWHVWRIAPDGDVKLKGEVYGYFHPIEDTENHIVDVNNDQPDEGDIVKLKEIPFELKAYNALMEKGVRTRDAVLRASFFTEDGRFFPYADATLTGMSEIKPYLTAYSSRGKVSIDLIQCYTYDFEYAGNYILEYDMFKVKWRTPETSGRTEGKGIRIWKRQHDQSLRLFREIGTHNYIQ